MGAISASDPLFQTPIELREALDLPDDRPTGQISKSSTTLKVYTQGLRPLVVPSQLSVDEAASLFEVWMKGKALHSRMLLFRLDQNLCIADSRF
jgi:small subunit ribosomal protein S29